MKALGVAPAALLLLQPLSPRRPALRMDSKDDASELLSPGDASLLRERIARIQQGGLATPAQKLFEIATEKPPSVLLSEFTTEAPPLVQQAMQDAMVSLLGALPPQLFRSKVTTTGDKLASLMLQLQMTGYMLRNAHYVMTLRTMLNIRSRSLAEYRAAFDRLDSDCSGYIERGEIDLLLSEVYEGKTPIYEISTLIELFDMDGDGRISWKEFVAGLGGDPEGAETSPSSRFVLPAAEKDAVSDPAIVQRVPIAGTVNVTLESGKNVTLDAAQYMEQLQMEAAALRAELSSLGGEGEVGAEEALATSISAYVSTLPEAQLKVLTQGISDDVVEAMKMVVKYIMQVPGEDGTLRPLPDSEQVVMEQERLQQLCLYQLVMGFRLREAEAVGEAQKRLGL